MQLSRRFGQLVLTSMAAIALAACTGQKVPAEKLIAEIQQTVTAASDEAKKYIPEQLMAVQTKLDELKASFDKKDYPAVVTGAPPVLDAAQSLATAAAAKKDEVLKALNDRWTALAGSVPGYMTAVQNRIETLGKKSNKKAAAGIDLDAARVGRERCGLAVVQGAGGVRRRQHGRGGQHGAERQGKGRGGGGDVEAGSFRSCGQIVSAVRQIYRARVPSLMIVAVPAM